MLPIEFKRLINQIGTPREWTDIVEVYKYNAIEERVIAFEKEVSSNTRIIFNFEGMANLLVKYEDIIDKDLYVLRLARLLGADVAMEKSIFSRSTDTERVTLSNVKQTKTQALQAAKNYLKKVDAIDIQSANRKVELHTSHEVLGNTGIDAKRKTNSEMMLQKIEETLGLEELLGYIKPSDLIQCCRYPNLGKLIAIKIINSLDENEALTYEYEDKVMSKEESFEKAKTTPAKMFNWDDFYKEVRQYAEYIDFDRVLVLANAVFYNKYGDDLEKFSYEEAVELKKFTEKVGELLENKKTSISSPRFNRTIAYKEIVGWVASLNKHFIGGVYHSVDEINQLANDIANGIVEPSVLSKEEFAEIMRFSVKEIGYIIENNPNALEYLMENEYIDQEVAHKAIDTQEEMTEEELVYAYKSGLIDNEKIALLYGSQIISIDAMRTLKENELEEKPLESLVSSKKLIELYFDKEKREEFDRYRKLFKLIKIDGKTIEEQREIADELIDESIELLEEEKMYDLYHMGLIPVDTTIEYVGQSALMNAFALGEIKPTDSKRLYDTGVITLQMLKDVLQDQSIDDGQKLVLIYSTFPNKEDADTRTQLINYLNEVLNGYKHSGSTSRTKKVVDEKKSDKTNLQNKYVSDPCSRWKLMASIDTEYSQEYLKDGHIIFYLPNEEKYIIEKLYHKKNVPAYGAATYILDEATFNQYRDEMIKNDKINRSLLVELWNSQRKNVKRLVHTGWGNALVEYFGIEDSKKYTKEECLAIQELAKEVEESKKLLEER